MISYYLAGAFLICVIYFKIFDIRKGWKNALILSGVFLVFYVTSQWILGSQTPSVAERIEEEKSKLILNIPPQRLIQLIEEDFERREIYFEEIGLIINSKGDDYSIRNAPSPSRGLGTDMLYNMKDGTLYLLFKKSIDYLKFIEKLEKKATSIKDPEEICKEIFELENDCYLCSKGLLSSAKGYTLLFTKGSPLKYKDR